MAISYLKTLLFAPILYIVYTSTKNWLRWRALRRWGKQFGCEDVPTMPNYLPGGIERYFLFFYRAWGVKKDDLDLLEDFVMIRFKELHTNTYRMYNPFNTSMINTAEPANVQAILATKFHDFHHGPIFRRNFFDMFGNGIFTAEGDEWARFRHQLKPQFARTQVADLDSADRHLQIMFKALPEEDAEGWVRDVDLMPLLYRFTMDVSTEFLFGKSVDSQTRTLHCSESGNSTEAQADMEFSNAMELGMKYVAWRNRLGKLFWLANSKDFRKACAAVKSFGDKVVAKALDSETKANGDEKKFVFLEELAKETRDPVELRDQVLHLLLAGRDTTSSLLSWMTILLARHPAEFNSLRKTVLETFGTVNEPKQELTFESLKACKAISNVLFETIRLYPLIPVNARRAIRDTVLPVGGGKDGKSPMVIMKGEQVSYTAYALQRREDLWGSDSTSWRPGRWEGRKLGWDFIGFSGGPRICLGQQYALTEAGFVIAKILQRYNRIEALDMTGELKKGLAITLRPGDGVKIRMHRASEPVIKE